MTWKTACAVALVGTFVTGTASAQARLYVTSTLSFRRSSTGHQHLEARQRGLRFKLGLAQMMRGKFVLLSAYRASQ